MTNDLQAISDGLRVKLLGEVVEFDDHSFMPMALNTCGRCRGVYGIDLADTCRPTLPLLSAPDQYWRILEALQAKRLRIEIDGYGGEERKVYIHLDTGYGTEYGATIGEAVVRASVAALGGERC